MIVIDSCFEGWGFVLDVFEVFVLDYIVDLISFEVVLDIFKYINGEGLVVVIVCIDFIEVNVWILR